MEMNLNDEVWVLLTEEGEETYKKHFRDLGEEPPPLEKSFHGYCEFEMWELMHIFGAQCGENAPNQFKDNTLLFTAPKF